MKPTDEDVHFQQWPGATSKPLLAPIPESCRISGLSRSELYRRLAAGDIRAVKSGSRTLILVDSLLAHLQTLQPATFRGKGKAA